MGRFWVTALSTFRSFLLSLPVLAAAPSSQAEVDWTGAWDTLWRDNGAVLYMQQDGDTVTGVYPLYDGRIEGRVRGRVLTGTYVEPPNSGPLVAILAPDGQSFMGRYDGGEWFTGGRIAPEEIAATGLLVDLSTPRAALKTFLVSANKARFGRHDYIAPGLRAVDFGEWGAALPAVERLRHATTLYRILDQLTFWTWEVPASVETTEIEVALPQPGSGKTFPLRFRYSEPEGAEAGWRLAPPEPEVLERHLKELLEYRNGVAPPPEAYLALRSPRDTLRTFLEEWKRWDAGGRDHILGTLNLSQVHASVRNEEGELLARYLKHVLERVSLVVYQEVPNDPRSRTPYVHFRHPAGNIKIAPFQADGSRAVTAADTSGEDGAEGVVWQFTPGTLRSLRALYAAFEDMPVIVGAAVEAETSPFFAIRDHLRTVHRELMRHVGGLELWQWLGLGLFFPVGLAVAFALTGLLLWLLYGKAARANILRDRRERYGLVWPMRVTILGLLWHFGVVGLGLPETAARSLRTGTAFLAVAGGAWLAVKAITAGAGAYRHRLSAAGHHEVFISLTSGLAKVGIVVAAILLTAQIFAWPFDRVLAGLGLGGLAVALAAQGTIQNFIGGFTLFADRPLSVGDFCRYGDKVGTVEGIGLRSTRIRSLERTVVTVPNAEFANLQLENFARRDRMLVRATLGLRYETTDDQLRFVLAELRELLIAHPRVLDDPARVRFVGFGEHALNVEVFAYVNTSDWNEFLAIQEDIYLRMMKVVREAGTSMAFPSRTLYHTRDPGVEAERQREAERQVQEWAAAQSLPFPDFAEADRERVVNTLDYPPRGSPKAELG